MKHRIRIVTMSIAAMSLIISGCGTRNSTTSSVSVTNHVTISSKRLGNALPPMHPSQLNISQNAELTMTLPTHTPKQNTIAPQVRPDFLNSQQGFAGVPSGLIFTSSGGHTWRRMQSPAGLIQDVHFTSPTTGWVVTSTGPSLQTSDETFHIYHTIDGGAHWQEQWNGQGAQFGWPDNPRIFAFSGQMSVAWVDGHLLKQSKDRSIWKAMKLPITGTPVEADFVSSSMGWAVVQQQSTSSASQAPTSKLIVLQTTDGGIHWHVQLHTMPFQGGGTMLQFGSSTNGLLLYKDTDYMETVMYRTTNGGKTWIKSIPTELEGRVFAGRPAFGQDNSVWIPLSAGAGPFASSILATNDMGQTWHTVVEHGEWRQIELSNRFENTSYVFAGLESGAALLKTTDDGKTWTQLYPGVEPAINISFVSRTVGFALGTGANENAILRTSNGGASWMTVGSLPNGIQAYDITFTSPNVGYVTVAPLKNSTKLGNTMIMKTNDGGRKWTPATVGGLPREILTKVSSQGYIVQPFYLLPGKGTNGQWILGTTGYPKLYTLLSVGSQTKIEATYDDPPGALEGYAFTSLKDGWMYVLRTAKSGDPNGQSVIKQLNPLNGTWVTKWTLPSGWSVEGMDRLSAQDAWLVAQKPWASMHPTFTIFRTTDGGKTWTKYEESNALCVTPPAMSGNSTFPIDFVNPDDGWLLTQQGLLRTTDGGATWKKVG
ncbi:hypothetical protein [Sulfoacidibacillus thermotolerans]|nr:hypothetical protein [Sulfoacidibacillus thermotolerans]